MKSMGTTKMAVSSVVCYITFFAQSLSACKCPDLAIPGAQSETAAVILYIARMKKEELFFSI